eukprot:761837-Hanusia_phi.AAC.1
MAPTRDQSVRRICLAKLLVLLVQALHGYAAGLTEQQTDLVGYGKIEASAMRSFLESHLAPTRRLYELANKNDRYLSEQDVRIAVERLKALHAGFANQSLVPTTIKFDNANKDFRFVGVVGSWSEWLEVHDMHKTADDLWETTCDLPVGKHELKFIVDGSWMLSDRYRRVDDCVGTTGNNVIHIVGEVMEEQGDSRGTGVLSKFQGGERFLQV